MGYITLMTRRLAHDYHNSRVLFLSRMIRKVRGRRRAPPQRNNLCQFLEALGIEFDAALNV